MNKTKYNKEAHEMLKKAEKSLKGGFWKNLTSTKEERIDKGLEYYERAINKFKLAKNCKIKRDRNCYYFSRMCDACESSE